MTAPSIRSSIIWDSGLGTGTTRDITMPNTISANDLILVCIACNSLSANINLTGFTELFDITSPARQIWFYKTAVGNEDGDIVVLNINISGAEVHGASMAISGTTIANVTYSTGTGSYDCPSLNDTSAIRPSDSLFLRTCVLKTPSDSVNVWTAPSGYTIIDDILGGATPDVGGCMSQRSGTTEYLEALGTFECTDGVNPITSTAKSTSTIRLVSSTANSTIYINDLNETSYNTGAVSTWTGTFNKAVSAGDVLVFALINSNTNTVITPPAGFTAGTTQTGQDPQGNFYYKIATGGETGASVVFDASEDGVALLFAVRGAIMTPAFSTWASVNGTSLPLGTASLEAVSASVFSLAVHGADVGGTYALTGYTNILNNSGTEYTSIWYSDDTFTGTSKTGTITKTSSGTTMEALSIAFGTTVAQNGSIFFGCNF